MVIALTGIVLAVVGRFMVQPVQGHLSAAARARLTDTADGALRHLAREVRTALPNSVRVSPSGLALELVPTTGAARYATAGTGPLDFTTTDTSFDVVGPALRLGGGAHLVFYNLGSGVTGSDVYAAANTAAEQATANRRTALNGAGLHTRLNMNSLAALPAAALAPPHRVYAVSTPVTYRCDLTAATLTRHAGYGFLASQPDPPATGSTALLADGVTACAFSADASQVLTRAALVQMRLTLSATTASGTETITLAHAIHVDNRP